MKDNNRKTLEQEQKQTEQDPVLLDWLNQVCNSEKTRSVYTSAMKMYCTVTNHSPTELISLAEEESNKKLREQSIFHFISLFKEHLRKNVSPTTQSTYLASISSFYTIYEIPVPKKLLRTDKATIQKENDLKITEKIITAAFDTADELMKIMMSCQYTSGLSMTDLLSITVEEFKENIKEGISCLAIKRQKTGVDFYTFLSPTATILIQDRIKKYRLEPEDYIVSETRAEQMKTDRYMYLFREFSKDLELPHIEGMYNRFHSHNLRKMFFNTILRIGGFEMSALAEYFMGHKIPSVRAAYFRADVELLRREYMKFVPTFESVLNTNK